MTKEEFYSKWLETFSFDIPKSDIKKYVNSTGNEAKEAYDRIDKKGAIYIEWFEDKHTKDITWDLNTANDLDDLVEVYVVGKDFKWTYIKTHEGMYGPYFMKSK